MNLHLKSNVPENLELTSSHKKIEWTFTSNRSQSKLCGELILWYLFVQFVTWSSMKSGWELSTFLDGREDPLQMMLVRRYGTTNIGRWLKRKPWNVWSKEFWWSEVSSISLYRGNTPKAPNTTHIIVSPNGQQPDVNFIKTIPHITCYALSGKMVKIEECNNTQIFRFLCKLTLTILNCFDIYICRYLFVFYYIIVLQVNDDLNSHMWLVLVTIRHVVCVMVTLFVSICVIVCVLIVDVCKYVLYHLYIA